MQKFVSALALKNLLDLDFVHVQDWGLGSFWEELSPRKEAAYWTGNDFVNADVEETLKSFEVEIFVRIVGRNGTVALVKVVDVVSLFEGWVSGAVNGI